MSENLRPDKTIAQINLEMTNLDEAKYLLGLFSAVIDYFPGGIVLTDKDLKVLICNKELQRMMEYPPSLFENRAPLLPELFHFNAVRGEYGPGNPETLVAEKMSLVEKRIAHCYERKRPDGRVLEIRGVPIENGGFVTSYTDVTERSNHQSKVFFQATRDSLTGLLNRFSLQDKFAQFAARSRRDEGFALFYIDLDKFKKINDVRGHRAGDAALVEVANRILTTIRESDVAARVGGDEFVVIQSKVSTMQDVVGLASRLISAISLPFTYEGDELHLGASIGVCASIMATGSLNLDAMIAQADLEMYKAKAGAKGQFVLRGCNSKVGNCSFDQCGCFAPATPANGHILLGTSKGIQ